MNELSPAELISAYLDGELTPDEQARAERLLEQDPATRRLFDEFRGMGSCLQDLPRQPLPEDFSQRVLRQAQQKTLATAPDTPPARFDPAPHPSWQARWRRPLGYVAAVLAASIAIAVFSPNAPRKDAPDRPVALAPRAATPEAAKPGDSFGIQPTSTPIPPPAEPPAAPTGSVANGRAQSAYFAQHEADAAKADAAKGDRAKDEGWTSQSLDNSLLVVTCEISPTASSQDAFRKVLSRNQISLGDTQRSGGASELEAAPGQAAPKLAERENVQRRGSEAGLELFYVEATPEQLEATLAEMASQPKEFLSVDVGAPEARPVQNRWQEQYSRGRDGLSQQRSLAGIPITTDARQALDRAPSAETKRQVQPDGDAGVAATSPARDPASIEKRGQQVSPPFGRARAYSMPMEGQIQQRADVQVQQRIAGAESAATKPNAKDGNSSAGVAGKSSSTTVSNLEDSATLRALFVLRVAEEQTTPAPPATKSADK